MTYQTSKFGGSANVTVVTNVNNHYGPRKSGGEVGVVKTEGKVYEMNVDFDADAVSNGAFPLLAPVLPAGAMIENVYLKVHEAFSLSGTTPAIEIGTEGSEATNGFTISEAQAEAAGSYDVTSALSGTWASPLAAETTVGIALSGTTPAVTAAGKAEVVVRYVVV